MSTKGTQPVAAGPVPAVAPAGPAPAAPVPSPWRRAQRTVGNAALVARLHTDEGAAALARAHGAKALTQGRDIYFGRGRFAPQTAAGGKLLRHELAHVAQNENAERSAGPPTPEPELEREARAVGQGRKASVEGKAGTGMVLRDPGDSDPDAPFCAAEPPVTMPEPATCAVPPEVSTSITLRPPTLGSEPSLGPLGEERIELGVPVESAEPIILYAVPTEYVFATEAEAAAPTCRDDRDAIAPPVSAPVGPPSVGPWIPPVTAFGGIAWTAHGQIDVVYVSPDFVITTNYVKFATGAAAMSLVSTSEGLMLVDAGVQVGSPNGLPGNPRQDLAAGAVRELVRHVGGRRIVKVLITHQHADHINLLPQIAEQIEIGTIQVTAAQAEGQVFRRVLDAVEQAQARYRTINLPARIEAEMAPERDAWLRERAFTDRLTPERAEAAWRAHVEARIQAAQAQVQFPRVELLIGGQGGQPILIEADLHRSPGEIEARVPQGTQRGGTITQPLRQGVVTTFTQPDADAALRFHPDTHSANYILTLPDNTQLVVVADPRDQDLVRTRENFERAMRAAGHEAKFRIVEGTHHMQRGMMTTEPAGPQRGHLVSNQWLVDAATMLAEIADQRGAAGRPARSAVVVGGAESRISPANVWLMRSLGYEAYVTTDARTVEMLSILDASGEKLTGLTGAPRGGGRPSQALALRAGLEIASLRQRIAALDTQIQATNNPADVQARADLQTRLADTRRLLHDYMDAFNQEIGRGSRDPSRPAVAPAAGVEPAAAARQALVRHLDQIGAAEPTAARLTPLAEPILVLIDRTQAVPLSPQQQQIHQHVQEIERIKAELEAGTPAAGRRVQLLGEMQGLRQLLRTEAQGLQGEEADFVQREIARLDTSIGSLEKALHVETQTTPDPASGGRSRTRIIAEQPINPEWTLGRQRLEKGFGLAGRGFGAVMVMHTITAQSGLNDRIAAGDTSAIEAIAGTAHNVHGFTVGVRMARLMPVHFGEFVVLAVLDFTATAAADYDSRDEARTAVAYSAFSNALNLALFAIGGAMMRAPNPWVAGAGFVVMMLGEPILRVSGAAAAFERWMSFEPSEVTGVEQELRDLMREYRIIVGALELSRRDLGSLRAQGATDPEALRQAALTAINTHRQEAANLEPAIVTAFESGYGRARTSYSGLSGLDTLRESFAELRARVWAGTERASGSAADEALLARFQTMEASLDLSQESAETIRNLEQWSSLDSKMNRLHDPLFHHGPQDMDWPSTLEDLRELERMFQNARYRLAPAEQGNHRLTPLLAVGSAARTAYEAELRTREERYSRFLSRLHSLAGGNTYPVQAWQPSPPDRLATARDHEEQLEPGAPNPGQALTPEGHPYRIAVPAIRTAADATSRVRTLRLYYESEVHDLAAAFDRSSLDRIWGSSADLEARYAELLRSSGLTESFRRLAAREVALSAAVAQARSLALLDASTSAETTRQLGEEIGAAEAAIHARRHDHGLILEHEIATSRTAIRRAEEQQVALVLGGDVQQQLGPLEGEALRSAELKSLGRNVTSAQNQLGRLNEAQAKLGGGALQLCRLGGFDQPLVDPATGAMAPIVGATGESHEVMTLEGHKIRKKVVPINAAAIEQLGGPGLTAVDSSRLSRVSVQELAQARQHSAPTGTPGTIHRTEHSNAAVPPAALARAAGDASPGRPLPRALGHEAARHFQLSAGGVRIHDDPRAHRLAADIDAHAFTRGSDIYFGAGRYAPSTRQGRVLLGHELAHVAQQRGGAARSANTRLEPAGSTLEHQAEWAGERFAAGHQAPVLAAAAPALYRFEGTSTTADDLIDRYTSWGDLDESGLGAKLVDLCWMSERHYPIVDQVMDSLWDFNEDDVARGFAAATSDQVADQFASTEAGRKMLRRLISEMADGMTWGEDSKLAIHLYSAIARREGADKGKERGLAVLEKAAAAPAKATTVRGADVLSIPELQERMRLLDAILERLALRYATDPDLLVALAVARERLAAKRTGLSVDNAPELSLYLTEGQMVAERVEEVLLNLDLQLAGYRTNSALAVQNEGLIAVTDRVRTGYLDALVTLLLPGNIAAFEKAEAVAAQLPRALTEAQLAQIEFRQPGFSLIEGSHQQLVAWIGVVRSELDQLETDARALRDARERKADDLKEREERFVAAQQKLELSLEAIGEWEKVLRAYEYLAGGFNLIYTAYGSIGTLQERMTAMRDAAYANDLATLRQRVEAHRNDPSVATFYKNMPLFISASQMLVSLGITLVAAIATAGVGGAVAGSLGTAATTTGRVLTFVGTAAVEAVTFTAVSRGLQSVAPGQQPHGSALVELAWNFGLFLLLRGVTSGITKGLEARGLEILATPLNLTASGTLLQGYGILRFRLEQGRFPTSDELAKMTVENLIMLIGITLATRSVGKVFEARDAYKTLQSFEHKYAWRFEALEVGRQGLLNKIRTALDQGQGADPKTVAELREAGALVEAEYTRLIEEIKADRSTPIEVAREELMAIDFAPGAGSQELLTQSLGLPEAVRLRNAGTIDQYSYEWGQTGSLEDGLINLGATVVKTADAATGLRALEVTFADRAPLTFVERASYFPLKGEVEIDPTDASLRALLTDFAITDAAAQRFVVRLLSVELSKNPAHGTTSAAKPVRKQLKLYKAAAEAEGKTTEQKLLEVRTQGLVGGKVDATVKAAADTLEASGILSSPEWLAARDPGNFRGTVTEWLAIEEISSRQLPAEILLRNIHFKGDLYTDPTLTTPLLDGQTGRPMRGVDAGSELDFMTVVEAGGMFEVQTVYNAKGYATGGSAAAAKQNAQALDVIRAAEAGTAAEITLNSGEKAFSDVKEIWGIDTRTNAEIELTGRLEEAPAGATQETIGLKQKGSTHTQQLPYDTKQIDQIVNLLRERHLMNTPDY